MKHLLLCLLLLAYASPGHAATTVRIGHFANLTHAQGVIGHHLTREHKGWFEKYLGPDIIVEWYVYNAGPSAAEGIFSKSIDLTYIGPSPSINAYIKSDGQEIRILAGSCSRGAALVVQPNGKIQDIADFKGKKMATPQFGNTQDVSARAWLRRNGFNVTRTGGDVLVIPTENPDQLGLFKNETVEAVWTIEPWVSQLVLLGNAKVFMEESKIWPETNGEYVTTQLVCRKHFLEQHPEIVKKIVLAHVELTEWINNNQKQAKEILAKEIKEETGFGISEAILDRAWNQVRFTYEPIRASLQRYAEEAYNIGFLRVKPVLDEIYSLQILKEIVREKHLPEVQ